MKLKPDDAGYPPALCRLDLPPTLAVSGPLARDPGRVVAIVGSREPSDDARSFAHQLGYHLARAGIVVVSGGAVGIDACAHAGSLKGGGATWLVAPHGRRATVPAVNKPIFDAVASGGTSRIIWPFDDRTMLDKLTPRRRNGVLVALAECVVVVQAKIRSGSRNAASWARYLQRPLYVVPSAPWDFAYSGSTIEILRGGQPLWSIPWLFQTLGLPPPDMNDPESLLEGREPFVLPLPQARPVRCQTYADPPLFRVDPGTWSEDEKVVFSCLSIAPTQQDAVIDRAGLSTSATLTALLTLSLKDVVVEGPDGFFRCRISI